MNKGITIAGNILVDIIKIIDSYPESGRLSNIFSESMGVGGCVTNTIIDLAKIDSSVPLKAIGMVGADDKGAFALDMLKKNGVDISGVIINSDTLTSYSDVMTVKSDGSRTFFHARGANACFAPEHINYDELSCDIFHLGYALLLDKFDMPHPEFGTQMAAVLSKVQDLGIKTSIDAVSENSDRFVSLVRPCLKYCNYVIINEIEAEMVSGIKLRVGKNLISENLLTVCNWFKDFGVKEIICIHFPEGAAALNVDTGEYAYLPSLNLPEGYIKGAVGAGDAFCAGMLYSLYKDLTLVECLKVASNTAACCLSEKDSISGIKDIEYIKNLDSIYTR